MMEIVQLIIGSGGLIGVLILIFRTGRIVEKLDSLDRSACEMKLDIKCINAKLGTIDIQIAKLETRLEERTLRVHYDSNKEYAGADR